MKKFVAIFFAVFLFLPRLVFAEFPTCEDNGKPSGGKDFSIAIQVLASANSGHSVILEQGNQGGYVLWYTDVNQIPEGTQNKTYEAVFYDPSLIAGNLYNILITNEVSGNGNSQINTLTYYRKLGSEPESSYVEFAKVTQTLKTGAYNVVSDSVSDVKCSDEVPTIPDPEPAPIEVCELFPSPAQTWVGNDTGTLTMTNQAKISGTPQSNGKRYVGFPVFDLSSQATCDDEQCFYDSGLMVQRLELESFPTSSEVVNIMDQQGATTFSGNEVLKELNVFNQGKAFFESGKYWIEQLTLAGTTIEVLSGQDVEIHVKTLHLKNQAKFFASDNAKLVVIVHGDNKVEIDSSEFTGLLYSEGEVEVRNSTAVVYGAVTAKTLSLIDSKVIATDNQCFTPEPSDDYELSMSPSTQLALMCGSDFPTFEIVTKSGSDFVSTPINISIPNADVEFTLNATPESGEECSISGSGGSCSFTSDSNGKLVLTVAANSNNAAIAAHSYNLRASLAEDSAQSQSASFSFVPYKIDVKPHSESARDNQVIPAIAGKSVTIDARVLACPAGESSAPVVLDYNKTLNKTAFSVTLSEPSTGSGNVSVDSMQFVDGQTGSAGVAVTFDESGEASILIKDEGFECSDFKDLIDPETGKCPIEGEVLQGTFSVKARPWKFAVCALDSQGNNTTADGNSEDGNSVGYVAAGDSFSVRVAPLKYGSSECDDSENLTHNYFLSENASVKLTYALDTPSKGSIGTLTEVEPSENDKGYIFSNLSYDEVGSIRLIVTETGAFYSSIEVDDEVGVSGESNIGRFYPKYFRIYEDDANYNEWAYPSEQSFTYMGQSFGVKVFYVEALNADNEPVSNYPLFDESLWAKFTLIDSTHSSRFLASKAYKGDWDRDNWEDDNLIDVDLKSIGRYECVVDSESECLVDNDGLIFNKDIDSYPDGPFNLYESNNGTEISITDADSEDDVIIFAGEGVLTIQPDIRFGRATLDDVGGHQGATLSVPFRAEYWNDQRFVQNSDDNGTTVESELEGQDLIWSSDEPRCDVNVEVVEDDTTNPQGYDVIPQAQVTQGKLPNDLNERLLAYQDCDDPPRQQSQLRMKLDNSLPWLKYDWNNNGAEENPSSVVTFGIHRGNDRVIYRGEPGLTGL